MRLKTDQLGDTLAFAHDSAGRLLSRDYRTRLDSPNSTIADTDTFTYDAASWMLTATSGRYSNDIALTYDTVGRKTSESFTMFGQTYTTTTQSNVVGRVSKLIYPDAREVTRTYTARGQLEKIIADLTTLDERGYDTLGRMTSSVYANGVSESRTYNADNTLASIQFSGAPIGDLSYTWDANHNKTSEDISGTMSGYAFTASYDVDDRLTGWDRADTALDQAWLLSPVGDWNEFSENDVNQTRTHGLAHELLTVDTKPVNHDPKGNQVSIPAILRSQSPTANSHPLALAWDFDNRLASADTNDDGIDDVFYRFDALGRRVFRDDGTDATVYVQNAQQTLADYASGASPSSPTYTYVWGEYIDELVTRTDASGANRYYHRNQQYSVTALTDEVVTVTERYAYDAYGTPTITNASGTTLTTSVENNRYTYTGREYDVALGLYHYRARMYDAGAGRFCSRDPIGFNGSRWLLYEYVEGQPLIAVDPSGLASPEECASISRRMTSVRKRIQRRNEDLSLDKLSLPETHPGDRLKPSLSRRGHRVLISKDKALLAKLVAEYAVKCGGDAPNCPEIRLHPVPVLVPVLVVPQVVAPPEPWWPKWLRPGIPSFPVFIMPIIVHPGGPNVA